MGVIYDGSWKGSGMVRTLARSATGEYVLRARNPASLKSVVAAVRSVMAPPVRFFFVELGAS